MRVTGKNGLGDIVKKVLQVCFVLGIGVLIVLPFILQSWGLSIQISAIIAYPNGIVLLMIMYNFIRLFNSLKSSNPFCDNNVKILKNTAILTTIGAIFWLVDLLLKFIIDSKLDIVFTLTLVFLCILFIGVSISLYILSELFREATEYKKENELTI